MDVVLDAYLESVVSVCEAVIAEPLTAVWIIGSLASDDFEALRSDIDILVICPSALPLETKRELARELSHDGLPCPAHGLDLLIYRKEAVERLARAPQYEFSISTGIAWEDEVSMGGPYPGGLIDLALAREHGRVLVGPDPQECAAQVPARWVVEELLAGIHWHAEKVHDPFHDPTGSNAVLNACRAMHYLSTGSFVSKGAGAKWLLQARPASIVEGALDGRGRHPPVPLDRDEVMSFLRDAIAAFEAPSHGDQE